MYLIKKLLNIKTLIIVPILTLLFITGCGKNNNTSSNNDVDTTVFSVDTNGAIQGDWIIIHEIADAQGMNPITTNDASASEIQAYIYETLNNIDPVTFDLIPYLAELPEVSTDHLTYTYQLKKNTAFSDGNPVTGEDVIFSMKAIKNPFADDAALRNYYESVTRVDLVNGDPYKIKITMSKPYWRAIYNNGIFPIVSKRVLDPQGLTDKFTWEELSSYKLASKDPNLRKFSDFFNSQEASREPKYIIGTGPYIYDNWKTGQEITLSRNPNYWDKSHTPAYINKIVFKTIQDNSAAVVAAKNNEIDAMYAIVPSDFYVSLKDAATYHLKKAQPYEPTFGYIGWNENSPIFSDKKVRLALAYLVDRKELIDKIMYGDAVEIESSVFYKYTKYLNDSLPLIPYDPEKAKQILSEEGWKDSDGDGILDKIIDGKKVDFKFTFLIYPSPVRKQILLVVIDALKKIGIKADLQELEWSVYLDRTKKHEFDATMGAWTISVLPPIHTSCGILLNQKVKAVIL